MIAIFTGGLLIVATCQLGLFWWQLKLMHSSIESSNASIKALESIASIIQLNAKRQSRAYRTGDHVTQDKGTNFKEQITMVLRNSGFTTAKKVNVRSDMDVFDYPLPNHINLTPSVEKLEAAGIVGANAEHTIGACLNRFIADDELDNIRFWRGRALYVFGRIEYEDVFGDFHFTNFCLIAAWNEKGEFQTFNASRGNDAD